MGRVYFVGTTNPDRDYDWFKDPTSARAIFATSGCSYVVKRRGFAKPVVLPDENSLLAYLAVLRQQNGSDGMRLKSFPRERFRMVASSADGRMSRLGILDKIRDVVGLEITL